MSIKTLALIVVALFCKATFAATVITADSLVDVNSGKLRSQPRITVDDGRIIEIQFGGAVPQAENVII